MSIPETRLYRLLRWSERYTKTDMVYLVAGGFWMNLGGVSVSFFSLILYIAFANLLPKETYGTYQYLLSIGAIVGTFALSGMNASVTQAVARGYEGTLRASIRLQLRWGLIPCAGSLVGAAYYAYTGNTYLALGLVVIGLFTPLLNACNTYNAFLIGKKDFKRAFLYNFALYVPYYSALILTAYLFDDALVLLFINLLVNTACVALLYYRTLVVYKPSQAIDPEALTFGKHLSFLGLFGALIAQADSILAFHFLGPAQLAIYAFATAIPDRVSNLFKNLGTTALPKFSQRSPEDIRRSLGPKLLTLTIGTGVAVGGYIVLAPYFFAFFFPQYSESVPYSALYALTIATAGGQVALSALLSQQRVKELYLISTVMPVAQFLLQLGGIVLYGLWGLVAAKVVSTGMSAFATTLLVLYPRQQPPV